jgi:predicted O-methyltransferase YrrM
MIATFVTGDEIRELRRLATAKRVLELGSQFGYSTVQMGSVAERVYACDWHFGDPQAGARDTLVEWAGHTSSLRRSGRVIGLVGRFDAILPLLQPASFDLIFHDGFHEAEAVAWDVRMALPLLSWGGSICFHDWGLFGVAGGVEPMLGKPDYVVDRLAVFTSLSGRWGSADAWTRGGEREVAP